MSTRASIILWSAGSGILLGLFVDALLIGVWTLIAAAVPSMAPRHFSRWASTAATLLLASIPIAAGILGYLEGRLKVE
ncbi:MAG: hypothetical protein ABIR92_07575 [Gemmatimonadaceae bacterium]